MNLPYHLAYKVGVTPWEHTRRGFDTQLSALLDFIPVPDNGRALDIGCGTGKHSIDMAKRGWQVTGVDNEQEALDKARIRAREAHSNIRFLHEDATDLHIAVDPGHMLVLDIGCFHGLNDHERGEYAESVNAVTAPEASLIMFAFSPGHRWPMPHGVSKDDVARAFDGWTMVSSDPADMADAPLPARAAHPCWYHLVRR
ncbi:class I SAM-dependent methyltransferase [Rhodococcus sp. ACPA4]|uniref:Methyltransferase family protein n=2 Tax=Nocardiaceae TaxID=85025 RepID=A0A652YTA4_NOCGL|nr:MULTISPECIES: class I SAM-dependent methyltransferase [Rhodococcus]NMD61111.1 methyltransferase domain-containing protein [Nocardia globerula]MCE4268502.1 class I SAM-dependent methyltransferase [Rhodococcus globerulus]MDV6266044.1 class I SAM-dependent methyltransferase [Rhodococcus globerulus]MDV8068614.1 class I SAM-dependent methyltransferase [Rhodococcus sp. IEGM 1366]NRI65015.1 methyltransferase domain-containing protein [Rhodococcus sp. MS16]